ncbi:MAG TPA: sodium:proton antiporter NhaD [Methylocella sp.]|nr:sodium:proton antiporter NhaD [Methylocella sp.]
MADFSLGGYPVKHRPLLARGLALAAALCFLLAAQADAQASRLEACRSGEPEARIAACTSIIARGTKESRVSRAAAHMSRAAAYRAKGDLSRAIEDLGRALRLNPRLAEARIERGALYLERGDLGRAIKDYDAALRINKNLAAAYAGRARAYRDKGDLDKAAADLGEAVKRSPEQAVFYAERGAIRHAKGEFGEAIDDYSEAIKRDPSNASYYEDRGQAWAAKGAFDEAIADFSESVALNSELAGVLMKRASAYRQKNELERAREDLDAALKLNPQLAGARKALEEINKLIAERAAPPPAAPLPAAPLAPEEAAKPLPPLTTHWAGLTALAIFAVAYVLVMTEEMTHLRKSKPAVIAAGLLWGLISFVYSSLGATEEVEKALRNVLLEYAELLLFLLVAMTYVNTLEERRVFDHLRARLVRSGLSYRQLFWLTGVLAFLMSPLADNLTTALVLCAVVMAVGAAAPRFVALSCINVVVAANAGGAFSPFGDITTLMVWQKGVVAFEQFFRLFFPSAANFLIPAALMHAAVPRGAPEARDERVTIKAGGRRVAALFLLTIATAVAVHMFFHLPPVLGMMTGLGYLQFFGYYLQRKYRSGTPGDFALDIFRRIERVEWDTLLFFYGVMMCIGALGLLGYLSLVSQLLYGGLGATAANVLIGVLSAVLDNIPLMFSVLTIQPDMPLGQWLLVTLTAGVGGSLLSIGSAAGVALMGQARGVYTFSAHLRWMPAVALGYAGSILTHIALNRDLF